MRLGFLVNPVAGVGGLLALHGSDGPAARKAVADGALGHAAARAGRALHGLSGMAVELLTVSGAMGEDIAAEANMSPTVVLRTGASTTAADTVVGVKAFVEAGAELIVFVGGDGTARDILDAGCTGPVLGVPAGVKMHSGVFAPSPATAAVVLQDLATGSAWSTDMADVIDRDECGVVRLFGALAVPRGSPRQPAKSLRQDADAALAAAITGVVATLRTEPLCFVGPGTTMLAVKHGLAPQATLLGVDCYAFGKALVLDADECTLWRLAQNAAPRLVLGVVGGQGFVLGRGNQQLSPRVLRRAQWPPLIAAAAEKLARISDGRLLLDTGDELLDQKLSGHVQVRTGPRRLMMMRVDAA